MDQKTVTSILDRIRWPHVAIVAIILASTVALMVLLPDDRWGTVARVILGLSGLAGSAGTVMRGGVLRDPPPSAPPPIPPRKMPSRRNDGSTHVDIPLIIAAGAMALVGIFRLVSSYISELMQ